MKIFHVLECWGNAGTERYVTGMVTGFKQPEYEMEFLVLGDITYRNGANKLPGKVECFTKYKYPIFKLMQYIHQNKQQDTIVHLHLYSSMFYVSIVMKLLGVKCVITYHLPLSEWNIRHKVQWVLSGFMARTKVVVSSFMSKEFERFFATSIIPPPVVIVDNEPKRADYSDVVSKVNIVCIGRLANKQKDWQTLVNAVSKLKNSTKQKINVYIIGGGKDELIINDLITRHNLANIITLTGHLEAEEVDSYLDSASISVLPSKYEGFGMSAVEAMAKGVFTITSNFPASRDYIKYDETGCFFPIGDDIELRNLLERFINNMEERVVIANKGREYALKTFNNICCANSYKSKYALMSE